MKKVALITVFTGMLFFACTKENIDDINIDATLTTQIQAWKDVAINQGFINKQQQISHYQFNGSQIDQILTDEAIAYVWFDLGINTSKQVTVALTGVDRHNSNITSVSSHIILQNNTDFKIKMLKSNLKIPVNGADLRKSYSSHIISNTEAFNFITDYRKQSLNYEAIITHADTRVERFGIAKEELLEIVSCPRAKDLVVFWGINTKNKMTTVIGAIDNTGAILMNNEIGQPCGSFRDFTNPCPTKCDIEKDRN